MDSTIIYCGIVVNWLNYCLFVQIVHALEVNFNVFIHEVIYCLSRSDFLIVVMLHTLFSINTYLEN